MYKEINKLKYNGTEYHIVGVQGPMGPKMTWDDLTSEQKESLKGPQGLQGIQGEIGPQGPKGEDLNFVVYTQEQYNNAVTNGTLSEQNLYLIV